MNSAKTYPMTLLRALCVSVRVWLILLGFALAFVLAYAFPVLFPLMQVALAVFGLLLLIDGWLLFQPNPTTFFARREVPDRLSNGNENPVTIFLESRYRFQTPVEVIDEIPVQFQRRDVLFRAMLTPHESQLIRYQLRPTRRGEYWFGALNVFVMSPLQLLKRRLRFDTDHMVLVYPSFLQMRQYELLAATNRLNEVGIKRIRRIGHSMEFEQVRPYTPGDDIRTINHKATARRSSGTDTALMVNAYQDENRNPCIA